MYREILRGSAKIPTATVCWRRRAVEKSMAFLTKGYQEDPDQDSARRAV